MSDDDANKSDADFSTRLREIMEMYGFATIADMARALGQDRSENLSRVMRNAKAKPGVDLVADLADKFDDLNINWFLTGKGSPRLGVIRPNPSSPSDEGFENPTILDPDIPRKGVSRGVSSPSKAQGSVRFVLHSGEGGEGEDAYGLLLEGLRRHHQAEEARFAAMARQMDELRAEVMALRRQLDER